MDITSFNHVLSMAGGTGTTGATGATGPRVKSINLSSGKSFNVATGVTAGTGPSGPTGRAAGRYSMAIDEVNQFVVLTPNDVAGSPGLTLEAFEYVPIDSIESISVFPS